MTHAQHANGCGCPDMQLIDVLEIAQEEWEDGKYNAILNAPDIAYPKAPDWFRKALFTRVCEALKVAAADTDATGIGDVLGDIVKTPDGTPSPLFHPLTKAQTRKVFKRALKTAWRKP